MWIPAFLEFSVLTSKLPCEAINVDPVPLTIQEMVDTAHLLMVSIYQIFGSRYGPLVAKSAANPGIKVRS